MLDERTYAVSVVTAHGDKLGLVTGSDLVAVIARMRVPTPAAPRRR